MWLRLRNTGYSTGKCCGSSNEWLQSFSSIISLIDFSDKYYSMVGFRDTRSKVIMETQPYGDVAPATTHISTYK
jgi:hypothetical protein